MPDPTLTITIGQPGDDLVLSGTPGVGDIGITRFVAPGRQPRLVFAPDSPYTHGSEAVGFSLQMALLVFDWVPDTATNETDVAVTYADVEAAISQFSYPVTTQLSDAPPQVWAAYAGSIPPVERTYASLANHNPVYTVTIPVQPIPGA